MMPKMFLMLALLAHGAVSVRPGTWLSEGQLNSEKVDEKKPQLVEKMFKKARNLKGWFSRKLEERKARQLQKLVDYVQKRVKEEVGVSATRHQVKELIRTVCAMFPEAQRWGVKDWSKVPSEELRRWAKFRLPLDVSASANAFCGELVKALAFDGSWAIVKELDSARKICSQVLTGDLATNSGAAKWAVKAAEVAEMDGQQHPYGRLDGVAWKHSLKRVCHDECEELVDGIRNRATLLVESAITDSGTIEDACAAKVVKHVEAEILGCCSKSCGWNGQFCSFFPFLNSTEQTAWQAECCSERNILKGSSRQRLCDSTLSQVDKNMSQNLTDQRPNKAKDREILGQDESDASNSVSLMERSFGGSVENRCAQDINLHNIYSELFNKDWKRMPSNQVEMGRRKQGKCEKTQESRDPCKAFLLDDIKVDQNEKTFKKYVYICWDACGLTPAANPKLESLAAHVENPDPNLGTTGVLFVHKDIYSTEWNIVPKLTSP